MRLFARPPLAKIKLNSLGTFTKSCNTDRVRDIDSGVVENVLTVLMRRGAFMVLREVQGEPGVGDDAYIRVAHSYHRALKVLPDRGI